MNMTKRQKAARFVIALCILMAAVLVVFGTTEVPDSQAAALTTPVASWPSSTDNSKWPVYFWVEEVMTASGASAEFKLQNYEALDLHHIIDVGTVNTATIKLQYSNDGSNWADGAAVVASVVADTNSMVQNYNFGAYTRLYATLANTETITVTVISLAK